MSSRSHPIVHYNWRHKSILSTIICSYHLFFRKMFFYEVFMIVFCVLPVTSSLFVSIYLFRLTREKRNAPIQQIDHSTVRTQIKSLVFIFATTAWTSTSLLPYRIFNLSRIYLFQFEKLTCEQKQQANWLAWLLLYLLTLNPVSHDDGHISSSTLSLSGFNFEVYCPFSKHVDIP